MLTTCGPQTRGQSSMINYQACTQPAEPIFARVLGETEDFAQACKAANFTRDQGERALRNPHVCGLAEDAHRKACEKHLQQLTAAVELAESVSALSSKALTKRFASRSDYNRAWGQAYDDSKRVERIKQAIIGLELRRQRAAYAFKDTRWELPEA